MPVFGAVSFEGGRIVHLTMDGQALPEFEVPSMIVQGRTFVPVRHVFEAMGASVDFHEVERRVLIAYNEHLTIMHIGSYEFMFDSEILRMDVAPQIIEGRTMVPLSAIATTMGFGIDWDNDTSTVSITTQTNQAPQNPPQATTPTHTAPPENTLPPPVTLPNPPATTTPAPPAVTTPPQNNQALSGMAGSSIDNSAPIFPESNMLTTANAITWNDVRNQFTISASSRITAVEWIMHDDGRLVIDIINASAGFTTSTQTINNGFLTTVRTGQNYIYGNSVARVVFDLTSPVSFRVALSYDRRHVVVTFEPNQISDISFVNTNAQNGRESVVITGVIAPQATPFFLSNPHRLVIDLPNAHLGFDNAIQSNGNLVGNVHFGQFEPTTARVVITLNQSVSFSIEEDVEAGTTTIHITEPTYRNIYHNPVTGVLSMRMPSQGLDAGQMVRFDNYLQLQYSFMLPGDFSEHLGFGTKWIQEAGLRYVEISTFEGITTINFLTQSIRAFIVTQDNEFIHFAPVNPRNAHPFVVYLDPGHGGQDPGTNHHGMRESDIVLEVSLMVREILQRDGRVQVYMSRHGDDTVANAHRAAMANEIADIFITVHVNAANGIATGTETLYFNHPSEPAGFSSRQMSQIFQNNLIAALGTNDRGLRHRPDLLVLNSTHIPAAFLELEFLDAPAGAARLSDPDFLYRAARAIVASIYETMEVFTPAR